MAMGLLGSLKAEELVAAIVHADLRSLMQAQGVGKRTAERLAVELRSRLQERFPELLNGAAATAEALPSAEAMPAGQGREDLQLTLAALGYEMLEIHRAIRAVAAQGDCSEGDTDGWIRECLRWLSRPAA
jgi:Holliday junction DNA helicase RuvA